ncbi:MAG: hypothetical protein PHR77_13690 [Kiritimatiellae bacterium]|nr:hypothetical protein [Kiritimatiellia bacterium]MDD5520118.1 hypothetical protein [Kiritimatiellia bacterium]
MKQLICFLVFLPITLFAQVRVQVESSRPIVWMMPPAYEKGRCFRELFEKPEGWKETRSLINVLAYTDLNLNKQFTDEELRKWFSMLQQWDIKLAMEVGAVKPWGVTGEITFNIERPMWDRIQRLGGNIHAIAMDEPLCCVRKDLHKPDDYAVEETASYIALVRKQFPEILVGDIEPYPFIQREDLVRWIDALQAKLVQMGGRGLDFFRLDVDWNHFTNGNATYPGNWREVKKLEIACRQRKVAFSLIYWAADYPHMKRLNIADDSTWYVSIMRQGYDYAFVGGTPDQYVIESWIEAPSCSLPEADEWTFTRSVRDFCRRFPKAAK